MMDFKISRKLKDNSSLDYNASQYKMKLEEVLKIN